MRIFSALTACTVLVSGCHQPAPKAAHVDHAWVRLPAVSGNPGAAYFVLSGGPVDDRLMTVTSPLANRAEMHDMAMGGGAMKGSGMSMAPMDAGVALPKGGTITFAPDGKHVMLFDIAPKATPGGKMPLEFRFASGATLQAEADIIAAGGAVPGQH